MDGIDKFISVVVLIFLIGALAPSALASLFNSSAYCGINCTVAPSVVPAYVTTVLGLLGVVGFIFIMLRAAKGGKH